MYLARLILANFIIITVRLRELKKFEALLKVSKSREQFMVPSILPKNERNSLSWASIYRDSGETINYFRNLLTFSTPWLKSTY